MEYRKGWRANSDVSTPSFFCMEDSSYGRRQPLIFRSFASVKLLVRGLDEFSGGAPVVCVQSVLDALCDLLRHPAEQVFHGREGRANARSRAASRAAAGFSQFYNGTRYAPELT